METTLTRMPIEGAKPNAAFRLESVANMIDARLLELEGCGLMPPVWKTAPAFEVHIESGFAELTRDLGTRLSLRHIVVSGERANVVAYYYEPTEVVSAAVSGRDALVAALMAGRVLRPRVTS